MPRIKTTRTVKVALWALRVYLLVLLVLIAFKFTRVFSQSQTQEKSPAATSAPAREPAAK